MRSEYDIFIIDDEAIILKAISQSIASLGCKTHAFSSGYECLEALKSRNCNLVISDINMPEMNGIDLLRQIKEIRPVLPVVMISGYGDIPVAVQAVKEGAIDFIEKPLDEEVFLPKITAILEKSSENRLTSLTPSEQLVLTHIVSGKSNKEIAYILNRSPRTIENHRCKIMEKLGAENAADLTRIALSQGLNKSAS